jgi:hypothetical protein
MHTTLYYKDIKRGDHLGDIGVDESLILRRLFDKQNMVMWAGYIWLRRGFSFGHILVKTEIKYKACITLTNERLLTSQERLRSLYEYLDGFYKLYS